MNDFNQFLLDIVKKVTSVTETLVFLTDIIRNLKFTDFWSNLGDYTRLVFNGADNQLFV